MSVYRELATELRTNKAVIDSLNSRNEQLLKQNQRLKREIHQVVQAALSLGQAAGVARPAVKGGVANGVYGETRDSAAEEDTPDTLANLVRAQGQSQSRKQSRRKQEESQEARLANSSVPDEEAPTIYEPLIPPTQPATPKAIRNRVPRPISESQSGDRSSRKQAPRLTKNSQPQTSSQSGSQSGSPFSAVMPKLFTEQSGDYRSSILEKSDEKEIGGIWLALSIVLIIVTAFGAGFLIMKPLLNER